MKKKLTVKELNKQIKEINCQRDNLARRLSEKRSNKEREDSESITDSDRDSLDFSLSHIS